MKMNPVVHFEMPLEDKERVSKFYSKVFGWEIKVMGEEYGGYVLAMTTPSDDNGPLKPGAINGGFFQKDPSKKDQYPHIVISVDDIAEAMKKVTEAGGKVLGGSYKAGEPDDIPGVGLYVSFIDSEGNHVGMLQPTEMAQDDKAA